MTKSFHKSFLYGAVALAVMAVPAQAEPGSSDRLLDLERIIEQQQQMIKNQAEAFEALKSRIETVEGRTQANTDAVVKNQAAVTAATRSVRRIDSAANPPKMVSSGNPNIKLAISGWVSKKVMWADDGGQDRTIIADDFNLPSRLRFVGKAKVDEKLSVGTHMEVGMSTNPSGIVQSPTGNNDASNRHGQGAVQIRNNASTQFGGQTFWQRKTDAWLAYKGLGKISVGFGDPAANTVNHTDVSGTWSAALPFGAQYIAGGINFRNSADDTANIQIGQAFADFDHASRRNRLRYDTPKFGGFKLSTSFLDAGGAGWDIAARYAGKHGDFKVKVTAGYTNCNACSSGGGAANRTVLSGTAGIGHSSGLAIVFGGGVWDFNSAAGVSRNDPTSYYGKLTYSFDAINWGKTSVGIDVQLADDVNADGDEAIYNSVFVMQQIKKGSADVYAKVGRFDLDRPGSPTDEIWIVQAGTRINF